MFIAGAGSNQTPYVRTTATAFSFDPSTNVLTVTATNARYADLAERYQSDAEYKPGTVVIFGGEYEITQSTYSHDGAVAGVISTDPGFLMNSELDNVTALPVALQGRTPCYVLGPINKGELVTSSNIPGIAQKLDEGKYQIGCIIGKSLESIADDSIALIEVVVGRF